MSVPAQKPAVRRSVEPAAPRTPEPTLDETFNWIRGKMLTLATANDPNETTDVLLTPEGEFKVKFGDRTSSTTYLKCLNLSSMSWDVFEPHEGARAYAKLLRLTTAGDCPVTSRIGYVPGGAEDKERGITRLVFSLSKASDVPDFQDRMERAWSRLVLLSGGKQGAQF